MNDVERALSQISDIHAQMAASTRFRGLTPEAVALTGLLAATVATCQTLWSETLAPDNFRYVIVWIAVALVACLILASEALARARRFHGSLAGTMIDGTIRLFLPFGAAGAAISFIICRTAPETVWILPGLWQILIALIGFTSVPHLPRAIVWSAGWYFLCGAVVLVLAGSDGILSPWMMGLPFTIGQGLVALTLYVDGRDSFGRR